MPILERGAMAPDFTLHATPDQTLTLSELRGKPAVLLFYPADWSPVCGDEIVLFNETRSEFEKNGATLIGISCDSAWCHAAYAKECKVHFPLLADYHPKGEVAANYGAYRDRDGHAERALFLIDQNGKIAWSYCSPVAVNPGVDGVLQALEDLTQREEPVHAKDTSHKP